MNRETLNKLKNLLSVPTHTWEEDRLIEHVINYNLPDDNEVYIHRSGRTGRAGNKGISIIIAHSRETRKIGFIEKMLKKEI